MAVIRDLSRGQAAGARRRRRKPGQTRTRSGAGVQHRDGAAVLHQQEMSLQTATGFLAVGDRAHPAGIDAARSEIASLIAPRRARCCIRGCRAVRVSLREGIAVVGLRHCACFPGSRSPAGSTGLVVSKNTRSPTLTTKSWWLPGVAALAIASGRGYSWRRHPSKAPPRSPPPALILEDASDISFRSPTLTRFHRHPVYRAMVTNVPSTLMSAGPDKCRRTAKSDRDGYDL